jgi:hypothetical protein
MYVERSRRLMHQDMTATSGFRSALLAATQVIEPDQAEAQRSIDIGTGWRGDCCNGDVPPTQHRPRMRRTETLLEIGIGGQFVDPPVGELPLEHPSKHGAKGLPIPLLPQPIVGWAGGVEQGQHRFMPAKALDYEFQPVSGLRFDADDAA